MSDPTIADPSEGPEMALVASPAGPVLVTGSPPPWFLAASLNPLSGDRSDLLGAAVDTAGISRKLDNERPPTAQLAQLSPQAGLQAAPSVLAPPAGPQGGGNLNGTQALILAAQAGTSGQRIATPRASAGNFCGVV